MKQEVLKDLCARLLYGVKILHQGWNYEWDQELSTLEKVTGIDDKFIYTKVIDAHNGEEYRDDKWPIDTFDGKLYLFPLSSMTEEQQIEYNILWENTFIHRIDGYMNKLYEFYKENHLDNNGLIPMGLAIDATGLNIY